ncbi:MAG TPA: NAD+ synthase [Chlamydiales bacterium]|nr:NAD+ synthase [Chlamydiales bacterium]
MKVFVAQLNPTVGDLDNNTAKVLAALERARKATADIVLFSELVLCGYPPEDLLFYPSFISAMEEKLEKIKPHTKGLFVALGLARKNPEGKEKGAFNSAAVLCDGELLGFKDKTLLPTYDVFDERRYFEPGKMQKVFSYKGKKIAVIICEDMWEHGGGVIFTKYRRDPILELQPERPDLLLNLSASPYYFQKRDFRVEIFAPCTKTLKCPLIFCNQVGGNDQLVFDGYSLYMNEKGELLKSAKGFVEEDMIIDLASSYKPIAFPYDAYDDLYSALVLGVKDYFQKQGFTKALVGLSGGIDSALVACIAVKALGKDNVLCLAMPSRYSADQSYNDALKLTKNLGVKLEKISIDSLFQSFLEELEPHFKNKPADITEENLQSRIRGMILMAFSNKFGHIVLSTGNKSEMAMGYATLYGDMCGGLGVLNDVTKMQIYALCKHINLKKEIIPDSIIKRIPTAELRPNQKDTDSLPEYPIVDTVLEEYVENLKTAEEISKKHGIDLSLVQDLIKRIHNAEYKRRQAPPGIRVTKRAFSKGRMFPIVQRWK